MSEIIEQFRMGWLPDYPDFRDYTIEQQEIAPKAQLVGQKDSVKDMVTQVGLGDLGKVKLPASVDLRQWLSLVEDQKDLGSCTAQAGVGLVEYFEIRAFGKYIDASRLFLYKVTRNLLRLTGDTGAYLRTTMGAMALFGVLPEEYWPYTDKKPDFDEEPPAFCYAFAQNYQAIQYFRLDPPGTSTKDLLHRIKAFLAAGLPSMFGFTVYSSIAQARATGKIPYPSSNDSYRGGHAVDAVGYDDNMKIKNTSPGSQETTGALLIRNSWGEDWGDHGYGWLPYEFVLGELAIDWWSLLTNEWVNTGIFHL